MRNQAAWAFGAALVAAQLLLWSVAAAGELELVGLVGALVAGWWLSRSRRRRLRALVPALALGVSALAFLHVALAEGADAPPGLAWFARSLCLVSGALLFQTPPQALVLHGLAVVLSLWTASALRTRLEPEAGLLSVIAIGATAYGIMLARSCELRSDADAATSVGVAPTPWGERRPWLPVAMVVVLTLAPLAAGWRLPRPVSLGVGAKGQSRVAGRVEGSDAKAPPVRRVAFMPQLRTDVGHEGLEEPNTRVMTVAARPEPGVLLLRGAGLSRATEQGWFPARTAEPSVDVASRKVTLEVELLRPQRQDGALRLFAFGDVLEWQGLPAAPALDGAGPYLLGAAPSTYRVVCEVPDASVSPADLKPFAAPELLELPESVRGDPRLVALAREVAWPRRADAKAGAVIRWLSTNHVYDGTHRVEGADLHTAVSEFLFGARRGICVEFANAAAVLMRLAGVPCRVVSGFRTHEREEGRFVVRSRHAHTWVEVAVDGAGWIPYDPSPPAGIGGTPTPEDDAAPASAASGSEEPGSSFARGAWTLRSGGALLGLLLVSLLGLGGYALSQKQLRADVALAQLGGEGVAPAVLLPDRARFFRLLEARGFDLTGAETPGEWLAGQPLSEPLLEEAVRHYTFLRFSGQEPAERVEAFRCSVRAVRARPAAARRNSTARRAINT